MNKKLLLIGISFMLIISGISGCIKETKDNGNDGGTPGNGQYNSPEPGDGDDLEVEIIITGASYQTVDI